MKTISKNIFLILLITAFYFSLTGFFHAIHISYGESEISKNTFSGKITFNKSDFFKTLKNFCSSSMSGYSNQQFDEIKFKYLGKHLRVKNNNGQNLELILQGNGEDDSSIWFTFKFLAHEKIKGIKIRNDALMKEFSDQLNLLNIKTASGEESKIFSKSSPELQITF